MRKAKKIYISGSISCAELEEALARFEAAHLYLAKQGYDVVNPMHLIDWKIEGEETLPETSVKMLHLIRDCGGRIEQRSISEVLFWNECMSVCFAELLTCDAIYMLNNWRQSKGARVELAVATELGMEIIIQNICTQINGF